MSFQSTWNQQKGAEELLTVAGCDTLAFPKHAVWNSGWQGWLVMVIFCSRDVVSIIYYLMTKQPQMSYWPAWNHGQYCHHQVVIFGQFFSPPVVVTTRNQWGCCCFEFLTLQEAECGSNLAALPSVLFISPCFWVLLLKCNIHQGLKYFFSIRYPDKLSLFSLT